VRAEKRHDALPKREIIAAGFQNVSAAGVGRCDPPGEVENGFFRQGLSRHRGLSVAEVPESGESLRDSSNVAKSESKLSMAETGSAPAESNLLVDVTFGAPDPAAPAKSASRAADDDEALGDELELPELADALAVGVAEPTLEPVPDAKPAAAKLGELPASTTVVVTV
jgi:hypothetical protein